MAAFSELQRKVVKFRDDRDWAQFHDPKDVAISLSLEANELLELFQWRNGPDAAKERRAEIGDELADVFYWTLLMAHDLDIDLERALSAKLEKNAKKYPVEKARGSAKKYTELG